MNIETTRFGEMEIDEPKIIQMRGAILGFGHLRRYILLIQDPKTPFYCFQSIDDGSVAFVVINPFIIKHDYEPIFKDEDFKFLEVEKQDDLMLLSIVTIKKKPFTVSVNLRAPIVINMRKMIGAQVVLMGTSHKIRHPIIIKQKTAHPEENFKEKNGSEISRIAHPVDI